jgi:threonine/homoserine/homoserine lactone efflux protein
MVNYELPIRGIATGLIIAAPVGPVNVLCIQRTLGKGWKSGLVSGLGAAAADTIYGSIAAFSITLVIDFLLREQFWIRVLGGLLLIAIGVLYYFRKPQTLEAGKDEATHSDFVSTFLLTATNPTTVLSFIAVLATLGMKEQRTALMTLLLVGGIFFGSMMWWTILTASVSALRSKINDGTMVWMNRVAGVAIGGFGIVNIILGMTPKRH